MYIGCITGCDGNVHAVISVLSPNNLNLQFIDYIVSFVEYVLEHYNPQNEFRGSIYTGIGGFCVLFLRLIQIIDQYNTNEEAKNNADSCQTHTKYEMSQFKILANKLCKACNVKNSKDLRTYLLQYIHAYNNCSLNDFESRKNQRYSLLEGIVYSLYILLVFDEICICLTGRELCSANCVLLLRSK